MPLAAPVGPPGLPKTRNRRDDVGRVEGALGRVLARPPLKGLSGAAVSANARLVRHLMTTTTDGIIPDLMAGDFRTNEAGRAKTANFLS